MQEIQIRSLGGKDPLEKEMATHSSILAWKILWTEEPGGLQSMGSQRVRHYWACIKKKRKRVWNISQVLLQKRWWWLFWASLVVQLVKICLQCGRPGFNPWVGKIPLEKGKTTHSSILAWRNPWTVCIVHGVTKSQTQLSDFHFLSLSSL